MTGEILTWEILTCISSVERKTNYREILAKEANLYIFFSEHFLTRKLSKYAVQWVLNGSFAKNDNLFFFQRIMIFSQGEKLKKLPC